MPAHAADLDTALQKKGGLTLSQLANYDDLITDALVDRVYFWSAIRKLKPNFHASRGIQEEAVCKILQRDVVIGRDAAMAHRNLLCLPGMTNYLRSLKTNDEKEHFERHLRKYVNMYLPECPFEVCTTNRYTILTHEACVVARRPIKQGEPIKFLSGIQVEMTEKEEEELSSRTDFSIVISSRRKRPSLFLGPARFANHDCDSNARLSTSGPHGIHIVARKSIAVGEEITVQYGDNYFGEDNCECLCASCEKAVRNGWDPKGPILHESDSESDDSDAEGERRSSRETTPRPSKTTNGDLKRKRAGGDDSEQPAKKGRLANSRTSLTNKPMSEAKAAKQAAQASQSAMTDWFSRRRDGDLDDDQLSNALAGLHDHIRTKTKPAKNRNSAKQVAERQSLFGSMIDLITATTTRKVAKVEREIHNLNGQVAAMMGIDVADVPRLCPTTAGKYRADLDKSDEDVAMSETPQQEDHVKIEDTDEDFSFTDHRPIGEEANEEEASEDEGPGILSASYTTFLRDFGKDGLRTLQNADRMQSGLSKEIVDRYMIKAAHSIRDSRLEMQKRERNEQRNTKEQSSVLTDHLAHTKLTQPSVKKERSQSNLRNVLNADEDVDVSIFDVPDSPEPVEARRESRERRNYGSGTKLAIDRSPRRVEATQNSTDSSSMSSVFSAEGRTGEASSLTSADHSPDRLDGFAAGSICQNIVEMYTTEPTPEDDETESERKKNDERVAGWSRGRLPVRKSSRRTTIDSPSQAMTSIEDNAAGEGENDDEEECKRGPPRTPGDYYLTESLLVTTYHRWVECRNCDEFFVQAEAYLTRIACPRCERHSKLYGFHWPKTEREGRHDTEERVLDHRTIHRFIDPEDERLERKGKRGLAEVIRERETSSRMSEGLGEGGGGRVERLRSSPRRSESRRKTRHSMQ